MSGRGGIARNAAMTVGFQALTALATIVTGIVIARTLGPPGRGVFAYATATLGILTTYADAAGTAILTQYKTEGLPSALVYRAMLRILPWVSLVLGGAALLASFLVPNQAALFAVACATPFALYVGMATSFLVADGLVQYANAV
ncbi:MAG TPA: hypothetical protein VGD50_03635, partial [Candidatus Baltobacteraceae bacterium]